MAFAQVQIDAETVLDAMNEDPQFAYEMWEGLAERLNMGMAADNFCDMIAVRENKAASLWIITQFEETFKTAKFLHLNKDE